MRSTIQARVDKAGGLFMVQMTHVTRMQEPSLEDYLPPLFQGHYNTGILIHSGNPEAFSQWSRLQSLQDTDNLCSNRGHVEKIVIEHKTTTTRKTNTLRSDSQL